jgi:hypothetical protein
MIERRMWPTVLAAGRRTRWRRVTLPCLVATTLGIGAGVFAWARPPESGTKSRMQQHGAQTMNLVRSVVLLDHKATALLARQIADDDAIARAVEPPGDVPELYQSFQVELRAAARRLADHAAAGDDLEIADAFGRMTKTCVLCHHNYLPASPNRPR